MHCFIGKRISVRVKVLQLFMMVVLNLKIGVNNLDLNYVILLLIKSEVTIMQTIQIDNAELESFISSQYGNDKTSLVSDFVKFVKTELIVNDIKKGFDEVELQKQGKATLTSAKVFLDELKSEH